MSKLNTINSIDKLLNIFLVVFRVYCLFINDSKSSHDRKSTITKKDMYYYIGNYFKFYNYASVLGQVNLV